MIRLLLRIQYRSLRLGNPDIGFAGIELDFISIIIIISGRRVIGGFGPGDMNAPALGKVITISGGINGLEGKVSLGVPFGPLGILNDHVGKGELGAGKAIYLGFPVQVFGVKSCLGIVSKAALGVDEDIGQIHHIARNGCRVLFQCIYAVCKLKVGGIVVFRTGRERIPKGITGIGNAFSTDVSVMRRFSVIGAEELAGTRNLSAGAVFAHT